jgi:hypothetical protein
MPYALSLSLSLPFLQDRQRNSWDLVLLLSRNLMHRKWTPVKRSCFRFTRDMKWFSCITFLLNPTQNIVLFIHSLFCVLQAIVFITLLFDTEFLWSWWETDSLKFDP